MTCVVCLPHIKQRPRQGCSAIWTVDGSGHHEDFPDLAGISELGARWRASPVERPEDVGRCGQTLLGDAGGGDPQEGAGHHGRRPAQERKPRNGSARVRDHVVVHVSLSVAVVASSPEP